MAHFTEQEEPGQIAVHKYIETLNLGKRNKSFVTGGSYNKVSDYK